MRKVPFPPSSRRKGCTDPVVVNGNYFLANGGRMAKFYCDTGYVNVPDTQVKVVYEKYSSFV